MNTSMSSRVARVAAAAVALLLLVVLIVMVWPGGEKATASAEFQRTVALFKKSEVKILGIKVGKVTKITPNGRTMKVDFEYDAKYKVSADAKAVIVSPNIVSDRFIQLTPAYSGGPVLADGADIPLERTAYPVELDRVYGSLNELNVGLGPQGANKDGARSRLLDVSAANLGGQGENFHATIEGLSAAIGTLGEGSDDLFGTIKDLQVFSTALAQNDASVRGFNTQLASVADQLSNEREELAAALDQLGIALTEVNGFVGRNKAQIAGSVNDLAAITSVIARHKDALAELMDTAPLGLSNLARTGHSLADTTNTRNNIGEMLQDPATWACTVIKQRLPQQLPACATLQTLFGEVQP